MIITLNQSEIETALTKHINDLMNLKEGVQIRYDFKATRGEEGITVTLDLSNGEDAQAATQTTAAPTKRAVPVRQPVEQAKEEAPFTPDNQQAASAGESSESTAGAAAETQSAETASAEAPAKKPSLFGNLGAAKQQAQ